MSAYRVARRVAALLLAAALLGACGTSATPSPAQSSPSASDLALIADLGAIFASPYDAAKVARLYAPNATLYDNIANETSKGLEAIQAKGSRYSGLGFASNATSAPIRQGDYVAYFEVHGVGTDTAPGLILVQVKDGKIQNQWVYDAGSSSAVSSPAANADEALVADLAAVASSPYDAAKVAALYAPDAVVHELTDANLTSTGLEAIQARFKDLAAGGFKVVVTSAPIRQDNFVAHFAKFGNTSELSGRGLVVYELKDGKVLNQWVYPAE
jgi:ketosteroid isomerase-like protein